MKNILFFICFLLISSSDIHARAHICPMFDYIRNISKMHAGKAAALPTSVSATIRFSPPPDESRIAELEASGLEFERHEGKILHTRNIWMVKVELDSLDSLANEPDILQIDSTYLPFAQSVLDVSVPQVQADTWNWIPPNGEIDGTGVIITNVDTGIDIYHPGFFKADGGRYDWIDVNGNGVFDCGIDAVDLNRNGIADENEILRILHAYIDTTHPWDDIPQDMLPHDPGNFDADIDWLYNDSNNNGKRDYGPLAGYGENDPGYGELIFIIDDKNGNGRLDPGEQLIALGTSKIVAAFDQGGWHFRGVNLLESGGNPDGHGTGAMGIVAGQTPSRRIVGVAPGAEIISINRLQTDIHSALLAAREMGSRIFMYEFGAWVGTHLDGSTNLERMMEDFWEYDGILQITAAGNLAGRERQKHAFSNLNPSESDSIVFGLHQNDRHNVAFVVISIHFRPQNPGFSPDPTITMLRNGESVVLPQPPPHPEGSATTSLDGFRITRYTTNTSLRGTNLLNIVIEKVQTPFDDKPFTMVIKNNDSQTLGFHTYMAHIYNTGGTSWMFGVQIENYTDNGTMTMPGTSLKGITVGAYDPRGTHSGPPAGIINNFSSWGYTVDGRRAVDITAPGSFTLSLRPGSQTQNPGYVKFGGTSAALPHVVGAAALILQSYPDMSPDEVAQVLYSGALQDEFTGNVPNTRWGHGKLRLWDSFIASGLEVSEEYQSAPAQFLVSHPFPNPFNPETSFIIEMPNQGMLDFAVYNLTGQKIRSMRVPVNAGSSRITWDGRNDSGVEVSSGIYLFRFNAGNKNIVRRGLLLK